VTSPSEVCAEIAAEHAADTIAAIHAGRVARLAAELQNYGEALIKLTDELARDRAIFQRGGDK